MDETAFAVHVWRLT